MNWSISSAAREFHSSDETIQKGLRASGLTIKRGGKFTTLQIHKALTGDLTFQKIRRERAEADKAEIEVKVAQGEVIQREVVAAFIQKTFGPVRERLMGLPGRVSASLSLTVEQRKILDAEVAATLAFCREHVPTQKEVEK